MDRDQVEKHYLDKIKVLFSEEVSVRQNFDTNPRGRTLSPNLPSAYCIASYFVQFIPLFASLASYFRAEHLNFPWRVIFDSNLLTLHPSMPLASYF